MNSVYTFEGYFGTREDPHYSFKMGFVARRFDDALDQFKTWVDAEKKTERGRGVTPEVVSMTRGEIAIILPSK